MKSFIGMATKAKKDLIYLKFVDGAALRQKIDEILCLCPLI